MRETECTLKIRNQIRFYVMPKAISLIDSCSSIKWQKIMQLQYWGQKITFLHLHWHGNHLSIKIMVGFSLGQMRLCGGALFLCLWSDSGHHCRCEIPHFNSFFSFLKHMLFLLLLGTRHNLDLKCFRWILSVLLTLSFLSVFCLMASCRKMFILLDTVSHLCHVTFQINERFHCDILFLY